MGIDAVPGTLRDPLFILDAIHTLDGGPRPETMVTDTASDSDIVFGLFAIHGYQPTAVNVLEPDVRDGHLARMAAFTTATLTWLANAPGSPPANRSPS